MKNPKLKKLKERIDILYNRHINPPVIYLTREQLEMIQNIPTIESLEELEKIE